MKDEMISDRLDYPSKYIDVLGSKMHYIEAGEGDPILFLHGVPTSSYIWRNIIPHLSSLGKCIAPDLIGFGRSDKPAIEYTIFDHIKYVNQFIQSLNLKNITIIMHGWGSVIGFNYAMEHQKNCKGLVFYEAFLRSMNDDEVSLPFQEQLAALEGQEDLFEPLMNGITFIDTILPQLVMRDLTDNEMNNYRHPFIQPGTGRQIIQYIKELPRGNGQSEVDKLIASYTAKLEKSSIPKLMMYTVPGFITTIATAIWAKEHLPNLEITDLGEELHLGQESYPDLMGEAISIWLQAIEQSHY